VLIRLGPLDQPQPGHVLDDAPPRLEALEARVLAGALVHPSVEADDLANLETVPAADLEVGGVVGRRHLDHARPELGVDRGVGHDLHANRAFDRGNLEFPPDVLRVPPVLRVDGEGRVAELRLRAHGRQ
jgi:hypothetical protein